MEGQGAGSSSTSTATSTVTTVAPPTAPPVLIIRLSPRPSIAWSQDTVDNEHLGRKSSKRCCIFHKVKKFAESDSDESASDTDAQGSEKSAGKSVQAYQRHHA